MVSNAAKMLILIIGMTLIFNLAGLPTVSQTLLSYTGIVFNAGTFQVLIQHHLR
jgi:hypothetical protein